MPRRKLKDFVCPRCGYTTNKTKDMVRHLYEIKKPCPADLNDIELTDELKEKIMIDRTIKEQAITNIVNNNIVNNTTNNNNNITNNTTNNTINNQINLHIHQFVLDSSFEHKLQLYAKCNNMMIDSLENRARIACEDVGWLDSKTNTIKNAHHVIKEETCKNIFDTISSAPEDCLSCIFKTDNDGYYNIFDGKKFVNRNEVESMQHIIGTLKNVFFDEYEQTLIKKKNDDDMDPNMKLRYYNILKAYYQLLHAFKMQPDIMTVDRDVWAKMISENDSYKLERIYNDFADIVKENTTRVTKQYNQIVHEFFKKMLINVTL